MRLRITRPYWISCIYLTAGCDSCRSKTPLGFFLQDDELSPRGSPQIVLQLSVGRNDVWLQSAMLYDTCTAQWPLNPSLPSSSITEEQRFLTVNSPVRLHLLSEYRQVVVAQHGCVQSVDALPRVTRGMRCLTVVLYGDTAKQETKRQVGESWTSSMMHQNMYDMYEAYFPLMAPYYLHFTLPIHII